MLKKFKKGKLHVGTVSLLFAVSWIILGNRTMPIGFIPDNVWFWLNTIIGYGGMIILIILIFMNKVKLFDNENDKTKQIPNSPPYKLNLTGDLSNMNHEQLEVTKYLTDKMQELKQSSNEGSNNEEDNKPKENPDINQKDKS